MLNQAVKCRKSEARNQGNTPCPVKNAATLATSANHPTRYFWAHATVNQIPKDQSVFCNVNVGLESMPSRAKGPRGFFVEQICVG